MGTIICIEKVAKPCTRRIDLIIQGRSLNTTIMHLISKLWSKIARRVRKLARRYVLLVIRYIVLPIIGLAGSKIVLKKPSASSLRSAWDTESGQALISKQSGKNWVRQYLSWTFQKGNRWAVFLLPFILILWACEEPGGAPSPESLMIYTLF